MKILLLDEKFVELPGAFFFIFIQSRTVISFDIDYDNEKHFSNYVSNPGSGENIFPLSTAGNFNRNSFS